MQQNPQIRRQSHENNMLLSQVKTYLEVEQNGVWSRIPRSYVMTYMYPFNNHYFFTWCMPPPPFFQITSTSTDQVYLILWLPVTSFISYLETKWYNSEMWSKRREVDIPSTNFHSYRIQISFLKFVYLFLSFCAYRK